MKLHLIILIFCLSVTQGELLSEGAESIPEGFTMKDLDPIGGRVPMPENWHYIGGKTDQGYLYIISEDETKELHFEVGLLIQMITGVSEKGMLPKEVCFMNRDNIREKAKAVLSECDDQEAGVLTEICIEVIEVNKNKPDHEYHVTYTLAWSEELDLVVFYSFNAPTEKWDEATEIFQHMRRFSLWDASRMKVEDEPVAGGDATR